MIQIARKKRFRLMTIGTTVITMVLLLMTTVAAASQIPVGGSGKKSVLFVGNNWDGTVDVVDPKQFTRIGRINVIPDLQERQRELFTDPVALGYYLAIRQLIGEGNDQYVDDMFTSHDGRYLYVSRPSLADVVGIDLKTQEIVWRVPMDGYRADHMGISPDGKRLLVSDSTERKVNVIDPIAGRKVAEFESGDTPHESNYSSDGERIFHASIGTVYTPTDQPILDSTKGDRWFQIVDAETYEVLKRWDIGEILEEHGYKDYSSAVRPMAISPDEKTAYLQLSFFHGFVEFDLETGTPVRLAHLPVSKEAQDIPREQYLLDSAHHGIAINEKGTKLCVAGTMSNYAAFVDAETFKYKLIQGVDKPYWATNSADGKYCFVSSSGDDSVWVLDYKSEEKVAEIPVGDHPQRMRMGVIQNEFLENLSVAQQEATDKEALLPISFLNR